MVDFRALTYLRDSANVLREEDYWFRSWKGIFWGLATRAKFSRRSRHNNAHLNMDGFNFTYAKTYIYDAVPNKYIHSNVYLTFSPHSHTTVPSTPLLHAHPSRTSRDEKRKIPSLTKG